MSSEVDTCEIRSGLNGVWDCAKVAIGTWQFDHAYGATQEPIKVCQWHANHFTRKGHWDAQAALKEFGK